MRKVFLGAAALSMILATGCQNEELVQQTSANEYSLTLDMSVGSRTLHNEAGECVWGDNEALYVVGDGGKVYGKLTMKSKSEGGKKAVFSGKIMGDPGKLQYMVYPVPQADGTIPMGNFDGTNHNAPMTGTIGSNGVVSDVDYAGGLVRLVVDGANTVNIQTENADGKSATSGTYTFNPSTGTLDFTPGLAATITTASVPENGVLYVPVAPKKQEGSNALTSEQKQIDMSVTIDDIGTPIEIENVEIESGAVKSNGLPEIEVTEGENGEPVIISYDVIKTYEQLVDSLASSTCSFAKLGASFELTSPLEINKDFTLHLDTFRLSASGTAIILKDGTFNLKGSAEVTTNDSGNTQVIIKHGLFAGVDAISIEGGENAEIVLNIDEYTKVDAKDCCVVVPNKNQSNNVTINTAGHLTSTGKYSTIHTNGLQAGITVNVTGGRIEGPANVAAIYFPSGGNLNITGGDISGGTGVYLKAGNLLINGETSIRGIAERREYQYYGNGYYITGDAVVIDNCNYPSLLGTISINGRVRLSSEHASPVGSYAGNNATEIKTGFIGEVDVLEGADFKALDYIAANKQTQTAFMLTKNIDLYSTLYIDKKVKLEIADNNITAVNNFDGDAMIVVKRGGELELEGIGCIDSNNQSDVYTAIKMTESGEETTNGTAVLRMKGDVTLKGYYYAISGNGKRHGTNIEIEKGKFEHYCVNDGSAIYHPQVGSLTINNGYFKGYNSAIEMRAGILTINGGNFEALSKNFSATANGDGTSIVGSALAISQHTTNHPITLTTLGGTFTGMYALYEDDLQDESCQVTMSVHGGSFHGKVYSAHCHKFILKDSYFTFDPREHEGTKTDYVNEQSDVKQMEKGMWLVYLK